MPDDDALERLSASGVRTDDDALRLVRALLERPIRRQCWLVFVGDPSRAPLIRLLMPSDDLPYEPADVDLFARTMTMVGERCDARLLIVVWERPGADRLAPCDEDWVREVAREFPGAGAPLFAQVFLGACGAEIVRPTDPEPALVSSGSGE
jgi:hypothetical protein